jgi:6-phosphogluconolactonase
VACVPHGRDEIRITMTYPALESAQRVAFLVAGKEKAAIFKEIQTGQSLVPAAQIRPTGDLFWFVDRAVVEEDLTSSKKI